MADADVRFVVATPDFPRIDGVDVLEPSEVDCRGRTSDEPPGGAADRCAYVIYTSGSTGRPKGVVVPHRNVLALLGATEADYDLGPDDVWTMFHSSAFDFSVWEIWGCLLTGGRLVVVSDWVTRATDEFHQLLSAERVTVLSQTPSAFSQLVEVDSGATERLSVRLVVFGGEPLAPQSLLPWFRRYSHAACRVVNMYGITETTVHVTTCTVTPADALRSSRSVGEPLAGWWVSVRDRHGRVLPPGAAGEIWVGGAGVAQCYLGRPKLTAERFVTDPVSDRRWYRSGDLGRMRPDGGLDHLGRIDNQVKIRGHRIELDEIRSVLMSAAAVSAAVVVVREGADAVTSRIEAYVVPSGAGDLGGLLDEARRRLPEYMIPASVTAIDEIPLTVNGKLDVDALGTAQPADRPAKPAPANDLTAEILALWSSHLGTDVGVDDNFFELGGNSLLVIRLLNDIRDRGYPQVSTLEFYRNSLAREFIALVRHRAEQVERA